jgi:hypothetical protein
MRFVCGWFEKQVGYHNECDHSSHGEELVFFPIFERADMHNSNISFFMVLLG